MQDYGLSAVRWISAKMRNRKSGVAAESRTGGNDPERAERLRSALRKNLGRRKEQKKIRKLHASDNEQNKDF